MDLFIHLPSNQFILFIYYSSDRLLNPHSYACNLSKNSNSLTNSHFAYLLSRVVLSIAFLLPARIKSIFESRWTRDASDFESPRAASKKSRDFGQNRFRHDRFRKRDGARSPCEEIHPRREVEIDDVRGWVHPTPHRIAIPQGPPKFCLGQVSSSGLSVETN